MRREIQEDAVNLFDAQQVRDSFKRWKNVWWYRCSFWTPSLFKLYFYTAIHPCLPHGNINEFPCVHRRPEVIPTWKILSALLQMRLIDALHPSRFSRIFFPLLFFKQCLRDVDWMDVQKKIMKWRKKEMQAIVAQCSDAVVNCTAASKQECVCVCACACSPSASILPRSKHM